MRHRFDDFPRQIRERMVELSHTPAGDRRVLVAHTWWSGAWLKWVGLVGGLGVVGATVRFLLERHHAHIRPRRDEEIFLMLAGGLALVLASVAGFVFHRVYPPAPYKLGAWVLTSYLMRLKRGWVELIPLVELGKPTIVTVLRNGRYSGSRLDLAPGWSFMFPSTKAVEEACSNVLRAKERFAHALGARDTRTLAEIDPFCECTLSNQWSGTGQQDAEGPRSPVVPGSMRLLQWVGALVGGGALAAALYALLTALHRKPAS